ncbi:MAG: ATP-binding cassette domain-containing protein [Oscillospiraceae bacterium]|nr:ATP-binding cassette domain-containing protein [Oscillospiraceae bacterium]
MQGAYFRYEKDAPDVLSDVSLTAGRGELLAILGGNGAGKTTLLRLLHGARKPQRGTVEVFGRTALLPQDPRTLFVKKTVREELSASDAPYDDVVRRCRLASLLDRHPFDLSGGESQRAALAKALLASPDILLLDEPTKGVDAAYKQELGALLRDLCADGVTVVMVSHDVEFCASFADRCALLFDGAVAAEGAPRAFFSGNGFYTTAANRMARELLPEAVTAEDVIYACGGEIHQTEPPAEQEIPPAPETQKACLPWWRIALAAVSGGAAVWMLVSFLTSGSLNELLASDGLTELSWAGLWRYSVLFASLIVLFAAVGRPASRVVRPQRTVPKRTIAAAAVIVLLIPLTIWLGESVLGGRKYYFISLLLLLEILLPFFLVFEGRKPKARELTVIAVLCALGVASRAVFFMLPQFKPVMAIAILAGVTFGGETGFLVGAVTMLVSNLMFSQGPWTPWQMVAMGLVGFLAGVIFRRGASRLTLSVFGALAAIFVYGLIMNTAAAVIWAHTLDRGILLTYYVTGLPVDCVHAAATALFLWLLTDPMLEKLERIKIKYGLLEKESGAS